MNSLEEQASSVLRTPIHKDMCSCWGSTVLYVDGNPQWVMGDNIEDNDIGSMLDKIPFMAGMFFTGNVLQHLHKISACLKHNIPVVLSTSELIPKSVLDEMSKVPKSGIQVPIELPRKELGESLEETFGKLKSLRELFILAKSWKISTSLYIKYNAMSYSKLDLYELMEYFRVCSNHLFIEMEDISKEDYAEHKDCWGDIEEKYDILEYDESWCMQVGYRSTFVADLYEYLRQRKVSLEVVDILPRYEKESSGSSIRYISSGLSPWPMGVPGVLYSQSAGLVKYNEEPPKHVICPRCHKEFMNMSNMGLSQVHKEKHLTE